MLCQDPLHSRHQYFAPSFRKVLTICSQLFVFDLIDSVKHGAVYQYTRTQQYVIKIIQGIQFLSCSNTGSIRDDPHRTCRKNSLELIELSSINKVSLV